jgi:hypothetical protein
MLFFIFFVQQFMQAENKIFVSNLCKSLLCIVLSLTLAYGSITWFGNGDDTASQTAQAESIDR